MSEIIANQLNNKEAYTTGINNNNPEHFFHKNYVKDILRELRINIILDKTFINDEVFEEWIKQKLNGC